MKQAPKEGTRLEPALRRSRLVNLALLVLALLALTGVVLTEESVTSAERQARQQHLLTAFRADDVTELKFEGSKPWRVVHQKPSTLTPSKAEAPRYRLLEPIKGEADEAAVDQLLRTLRYSTWLRELTTTDGQRVQLGLEKPEWVLHVTMGDLKYRLRLGAEAKSPAGAHYLEVTGENVPKKGVFVVSSSTVKDLEMGPEELRVRRLIPVEEPDIAGVTLGFGDKRYQLIQHARNDWRFAKRYGGARLSRAAVDRLFVQLSRTQAEDFLALDEARQLQAQSGESDHPIVQLTIEPKTSKPEAKAAARLQLSIGGECPSQKHRVVAIRTEPEPLAACIPGDILGAFESRPEVMLERKLFQLRSDEVEELVIERRGGTARAERLELARSGDGFRMRAPKEANVEGEAATGRIDALLGVAGELLSEPPKRSTDVPVWRVTVSGVALTEEQKPEEVVEVWQGQGADEMFATRLADNKTLRISGSVRSLVLIDASLLRSLAVLDLDVKELREVMVHGPNLHQRVVQRERGVFELKEPEDYAADGSFCVELFDEMAHLRAESWVSDTTDGDYGFGGVGVARVGLKTEARTFELHVGKATPEGGYYASLDNDGVFVMPRRVRERLEQWALNRSRFMLSPESTVELSLENQQGIRRFERLGTEFVQTSGTSLSERRIQDIVDALSLLTAEGAVSLGPATPKHGLSQPLLRVRWTTRQGPEGALSTSAWRLGVGDTFRNVGVFYAKFEDRDAVYGLPRASVQRILDAL